MATTTLLPNQQIQLQSFWNLIQTTDETVQKELYILLQNKYDRHSSTDNTVTILDLQGILKGSGSESTDREMLSEYLQEKYEV